MWYWEGGERKTHPLGATSHLWFPIGWTAFPRSLVGPSPQNGTRLGFWERERAAPPPDLRFLGLVAHNGSPGGVEAPAEGRPVFLVLALTLLEPPFSPSPGLKAKGPGERWATNPLPAACWVTREIWS